MWKGVFMDSFEPVEVESTPREGLEDDDLNVALLTSSREAFAGFSNLAAMPPLPIRDRFAPWRQR
jgi:hypothetical protein